MIVPIVLYMAAEAYNEIGTDRQEVWNLLNSVRTRAESTPEKKFRTAHYWERGFELAFEGQRKHDLMHWEVLGKALKLFGEASSVNRKENKPYPVYRNSTEGKHELFPIPLKGYKVILN